MKETINRPAIRSVLLECRSYRDTAGNTNTSAAVWINGGFIGVLGLRYGSPEVLEHYALTPYLERAGIIPEPTPGEYASHLRYRLADIGADYYFTQEATTRRRCWKDTEIEEGAILWQTLEIRERSRVTA